MKKPTIDLSQCNLCGGCVELCPSVFKNSDFDYVEIAELCSYPRFEVNEAIKYCPEDCIYWEECQ